MIYRLAILLLVALGMQSGPQPVTVPIVNPTFTQGTTGWQFGANGGITDVGGVPVAYANYGGTFYQTLSTTPKMIQAPINGVPGYPYVADGFYTLKFSVTNKLGVYPGYWTAEIDYGTQELCTASSWGTQSWDQITVICPNPGYLIIDHALSDTGASSPVQSAQPFVIHFTVGGWPVLFDNVSLTFTPD